MTHTSHPLGFRLGITKNWRAQWFSPDKKKFKALLKEDYLIRNFLEEELKSKMVSEILLERERGVLSILIKTARPGLIIGREGTGVDDLINRIKSFARKNELSEDVKVRVEEVRFVEQDATLVADSIVEALKKRAHFRRLMKQTVEKVMANREVRGCRIVIKGRLGGAEMARTEEIKTGKIPLQTLRADIDYAYKRAIMPYGTLGVKVWIYKGEVEDKK